MKDKFYLFAACAALAAGVFGAQLTGRVVKVADGDTITVLDAGKTQHKVRLNAIDAPEKAQAHGEESRRHLAGFVAGRDVTVEWESKDRYGRILGTVWHDGMEVNLQMVEDGYAWHYKRYDRTKAYADAETDARNWMRGLWRDPAPVQPEEFRRIARGGSDKAGTDARTSGPYLGHEEYRAGNAMPVGSREAAPVCDKWPDTGYWLSTSSNKRHNRRCENYRKTRGYPCGKDDGVACRKCGG